MTSIYDSDDGDDDDDEERNKFILQKYQNRLKLLRLGQEYSQKDDIPNSVKAYVKYLQALADYYGVEENQLNPNLFKKQNNIVEILMVSQVYWDLSKSYDRAPKLKSECQRCLKQFMRFSIGFKFQYLNSEMLRKYIKRRVAHNPKLFEDAYNEMRDQSKKCYIASYCFDQQHPTLQTLRDFKRFLNNFYVGKVLIDIYYFISIRLVFFLRKRPFLSLVFTNATRPILILFSKSIHLFKIIK